MKHKIGIYNQIDNIGLNLLTKQSYALADKADNPDAILLRSHSLINHTLNENLLAIARAGAGTNNIPVERCTEKGIVVFNTPGANANAVKELVIVSMLLQFRNILKSYNFCNTIVADNNNLDDKQINTLIEANKKQFKGNELYGKSIGIIGLGAIGSMLANSCEQLGMKVYGYDPKMSIAAAWRLSQTVVPCETVAELLNTVDVISLHIPLLEATKGFVDSKFFDNVKQKPLLLNFSRAGIVAEADLIKALDANIISNYICDFPSAKLLNHSKVTTLPHLGASTVESEKNCALMSCNQLIEFLEYGNIKNSVNFPNVKLTKSQNTFRISIINKNVPNVISNILNALQNNNIIEMINKSNGDIAYNLFDLTTNISEEQLQQIQAMPNVIAVRCFN